MKCRNHGFSYLGLMLAIAVSSAALAAGAEVWHTILKREKEQELLFVGDQFRQAIALYYLAGSGRKYPTSLEDLLKDPRQPGTQRYLRKIYRDPITGTTEWGLVIAPNGGIMGVHSLSEDRPLKNANFQGGDQGFGGHPKYSEWQFVYRPRIAAVPQRMPNVLGGRK